MICLKCCAVFRIALIGLTFTVPLAAAAQAGGQSFSQASRPTQNRDISTQSTFIQGPPATKEASTGNASSDDPVGEAVALCRKGDFEKAIAKYVQILQDRPKSPDAYAGLIRVYLKQNKVDSAEQTADAALARVDSPRVRVAYAEVLFRQGKIDQAEVEWAKAINAGFPEARAYLGLARVRSARALYRGAAGMINRAHELDPDDPDIEELWIPTLSRKDRIKYLETALANHKDWDSDKRQSVSGYVQYLKDQAQTKFQPCRLMSNTATTQIPLTWVNADDGYSLSAWGLTVFLNGHKSLLPIDTGSTGILLGRKAAARAGISKIASTTVGGIGGKGFRNGYVGILDSIQVGDLVFVGCPVQVLEDREVAGRDGLIGTDVFEDFLVDLNLPASTLRLSQLPRRPGEPEPTLALRNEDLSADEADNADTNVATAADDKHTAPGSNFSAFHDAYIATEMQSFTRLFRFGHHLLIPTTIGSVSGKLFLLDTGAFDNSISPSAAREVTKVHGDANTIVKGISGSVKNVYAAKKVVLQFGHFRNENQDMVAFDTSAISNDDGTEISGMLGFKLLSRLDIKIDYRDALIDFSYNPDRWK